MTSPGILRPQDIQCSVSAREKSKEGNERKIASSEIILDKGGRCLIKTRVEGRADAKSA